MRSLWEQYDEELPRVAYEYKVRGSHPLMRDPVVDVGSRHKKVAHPGDVSTWTFPPGMLDLGSDEDDDEDDLETGIELLIHSLLG